MKLCLGLGLGCNMPPPVSVIDTEDLTAINPLNAEVLSANSFRVAQDPVLDGQFTANVEPGSYRVRCTVDAYDGLVAGIVGIGFRISDNITARSTVTVSEFLDVTVVISTGILRFGSNAIGNGAKITGLLVVRVS
jgi:hypothetical protein